MNEKKLVSILTPCYNGEQYIFRLLDSVLKQSYENVEMLVIDDGSIDKTVEIIHSYISKFKNRGYDLRYIYQPNQGQSAAINNGLKLIRGDYLVWPDSDDFYATNDAVELMANLLDENSEEVSMVRTLAYYLDEKTLTVTGKTGEKYCKNRKTDLFQDCLFAQNGYWFCPGEYMVRVSTLQECIPKLEIFTSQYAGQNWQLMLPVLYKHKCLTIEKCCYNIVTRTESHSRGMFITLNEVLNKFKAYENTLIETLHRMPHLSISERDKLIDKIQVKYKIARIEVLLEYSSKRDAWSLLRELSVATLIKMPLKKQIGIFLAFLPFGKETITFMKHFWKR